MMQTICRIAILVASGLLILNPLIPMKLDGLTGILGVVILITSIPNMGNTYKKPVYVFVVLSIFLFVKYGLSFGVIVDGVNSMLAIAAIVATLQIFSIPIKVGNYDLALEEYLQRNYKKEVSLFTFLNLITHVLGSFMLFGCIPMLFTIFTDPLDKMVHNSKRFLGTALSRSFSLVTLWAPGTVNVVLVSQATGVKWLDILFPAVLLTIMGLATSIFLEYRYHLKGKMVQKEVISVQKNKEAGAEEIIKLRTLLLIAVGLIASIVIMENLHVLNGTTRVLVSGLVIASIWTFKYKGNPELKPAWQEYWGKSIYVARDLAALFISMGIFAEMVNQAGLISYIQVGLLGGVGLLGKFSFLLIPPVIILLSLVGIHPFISTMLIGKILVTAIQIPNYEVLIALALLLGGVISFVLSPFAGNVLTISRMSDCSPSEVGYGWNGVFSIVFLLEGFVFLFLLQMIWH
ncbi:MAG: hypothetical protein CVU87_07945 [Firmicutes bacterium HGW-Firmicutes-12]|jgi:hypothetical protein|nr:MAG: hypothetical protein CVU87_07945 [Firmicutes bacterium HGW-Firmicutes-12]